MNRFGLMIDVRPGICSIQRERVEVYGESYMCRVRVEVNGIRRPGMEKTLSEIVGNNTSLCLAFVINDRHWDLICSLLRRAGWKDNRTRFSDFADVVRAIKAV